MAIADDLDVQASADWVLIPERPENGVIYRGQTRAFESVRNAVRFVIEQLPSQQRATAQIRTDHGLTYDISEIEQAYKTVRQGLR